MIGARECVIADAGPIIALSLIGRLGLLRELYGATITTDAVFREVSESTDKPVSDAIHAHPWIQVVEDPPLPDVWLGTVLDFGEASIIALALQMPHARLLIDERKGRRLAHEVYHLPMIGTGGVLVRAKSRGLIPAVRPLLLALQAEGYHLRSGLIDALSRAAGE